MKTLREHIVRSGGKFTLKSHKGKNLGTYSSRAGAEKRERQVEYFKHVKEEYDRKKSLRAIERRTAESMRARQKERQDRDPSYALRAKWAAEKAAKSKKKVDEKFELSAQHPHGGEEHKFRARAKTHGHVKELFRSVRREYPEHHVTVHNTESGSVHTFRTGEGYKPQYVENVNESRRSRKKIDWNKVGREEEKFQAKQDGMSMRHARRWRRAAGSELSKKNIKDEFAKLDESMGWKHMAFKLAQKRQQDKKKREEDPRAEDRRDDAREIEHEMRIRSKDYDIDHGIHEAEENVKFYASSQAAGVDHPRKDMKKHGQLWSKYAHVGKVRYISDKGAGLELPKSHYDAFKREHEKHGIDYMLSRDVHEDVDAQYRARVNHYAQLHAAEKHPELKKHYWELIKKYSRMAQHRESVNEAEKTMSTKDAHSKYEHHRHEHRMAIWPSHAGKPISSRSVKYHGRMKNHYADILKKRGFKSDIHGNMYRESMEEQLSCAVPNSRPGSIVPPSARQKFVWNALRSDKFGALKQAVVKSYLKHRGPHHSPIIPANEVNESGGERLKRSAMEMKRRGDMYGHYQHMAAYHEHMADAMHDNAKHHGMLSGKGRQFHDQAKKHERHADKFHNLAGQSPVKESGPALPSDSDDERKRKQGLLKLHNHHDGTSRWSTRRAMIAHARHGNFDGKGVHRAVEMVKDRMKHQKKLPLPEEEETLQQRIARQRAAREARDGTPDQVKTREKAARDAFHARKSQAFGQALDAAMSHIKSNPNMSIHHATRMMQGLNRLGRMKYRKGK